MILEWNKKNKPQLNENMIVIGVKHQYTLKKVQMSPNCKNPGFYEDYGVCIPDKFCEIIKNPVTYTLNRAKNAAKKRRKPRKKSVKKESVQKKE
jgi:hypothetical protein